MRKKIFKAFLYVAFGPAVLVAMAAALTQTRPFKNWLRTQVVNLSREAINGTLHLGRIDGNLLTRFGFSDVAIIQERDTVVFVPRLQMALQPFALLRRELRLSMVRVQAPCIFVRQLGDSSLNISHLLRRDAEKAPRPAPLRLAVHVDDFALSNARVEYRSLDTLPRLFEVVRARIRGRFVDNRLVVAIGELQLNTSAPDLRIRDAQVEITASGDSLRLRSISLRTAKSHLRGEVAVRSLTAGDFSVDATLDSLLLEEVQALVPGLGIGGALNGRVHASRLAGVVRAEADLRYGITTANLTGSWSPTDSSYALEAVVRQLDLAAFGIDSTRHSWVNARLTAEGRGLEWPRASSRAVVWLDSSSLAGFHLPRVEIEGQLSAGRLHARLDYRSSLGTAEVVSDVYDFFGVPIYDYRVVLDDLDLARFLASRTPEKAPYGRAMRAAGPAHAAQEVPDVLYTRLSLTCTGSGRAFDPGKMEMNANVHAVASAVGIATVDSLHAALRVYGNKVRIDSLQWYGPTATLSAAGEVGFGFECDVRFRGQLGDLELIRQLVEADSLRAKGFFSGTITGPLDSLLVKAEVALRDLHWNRNNIGQVSGMMTYAARLGGGTITADGGRLLLGVVPLDTATVLIKYDLGKMDFQSSFARGQHDYGEIDGRYTFGDTARLDIQRVEIFLLGQVWKNSFAPVWIDIGDEVYLLHNVILSSAEQRVFAEGRLDYRGEEDLQLGVENLNFASIAAFLGRSGDFAGVLNASARLLGTAPAPLLQGKFELRDGRIAGFKFPRTYGTIGYADERFFWDFELAQNGTRTLVGEGFLPMNLALDYYGDVFFRDRPMRIQFSTNGLDLAFLQTVLPRAKNLKGIIAFNVALENNWQHPLPLGYLRVVNGGFSVPKYGTEYRDVKLSVVVDTSFVELQSFEMASGEGRLTAEGLMNFTSEAISGIEASLHAEDFTVAHNRDVDLRINADINIGGTLNEAGFAGDVAVARSRFFLPALQPTTVLQLDEKQRAAPTTDSAKIADDRLANLLRNSYGELRVLIPRNTWLRGPEINVEIEGELDLVVDGTSLLLFGTINVVRGTYELYGNKFVIERGSLTFQGSKDLLPEINLEAARAYRNLRTKEKQTLRINITGNPNAPKIAFQRDNEAIEEKDAVAYLLFGVSFDELTQGQKTEVAHQDNSSPVMSAASGLLTGLVSKQISNSLARGLNLDVIEFQSGEALDLKQSAVLVGKYISNDLFLSYSRDFSSGDAQRVALEYEIAKFLFLQAAKSNEKDTGFDLIWKLEW